METVGSWLDNFSSALASHDFNRAGALFDGEQSFVRDVVGFTWNVATIESATKIQQMLETCVPDQEPVAGSWRVITKTAQDNGGVHQAQFHFETKVLRGRGLVRVHADTGKAWQLVLRGEDLVDHPEECGARLTRPHGAAADRNGDLTDWHGGSALGHGKHAEQVRSYPFSERLKQEHEDFSNDPFVVVVGGGQTGLVLAANLKRKGVPHIVIERNANAGDSWRFRYRSLNLHTPQDWNELPYFPIPDHWPAYLDKDLYADYLDMYAKAMLINMWGNSEILGAEFNEDTQKWTLKVNRGGQEVNVHCAHVVLASGHNQEDYPNIPKLEGSEGFKGEIMHSTQFQDGSDFTGKKVMVVGTGNSAHDIAGDLYRNGAEVSMLQRGALYVQRLDTIEKTLYRMTGGDRLQQAMGDPDALNFARNSVPYKVMYQTSTQMRDQLLLEPERDMHAKLTAAGFKLPAEPMHVSLYVASRFGGFHIGMGTPELICDGKIKMHSGPIKRLHEKEVELPNGDKVEADTIMLCTGFSSGFSNTIKLLLGRDIAEKVGLCQGIGLGELVPDMAKFDPGPFEGEIRNFWKPTPFPNLWLGTGTVFNVRFFALPLALQLKARYEGVRTTTYPPPQKRHPAIMTD